MRIDGLVQSWMGLVPANFPESACNFQALPCALGQAGNSNAFATMPFQGRFRNRRSIEAQRGRCPNFGWHVPESSKGVVFDQLCSRPTPCAEVPHKCAGYIVVEEPRPSQNLRDVPSIEHFKFGHCRRAVGQRKAQIFFESDLPRRSKAALTSIGSRWMFSTLKRSMWAIAAPRATSRSPSVWTSKPAPPPSRSQMRW